MRAEKNMVGWTGVSYISEALSIGAVEANDAVNMRCGLVEFTESRYRLVHIHKCCEHGILWPLTPCFVHGTCKCECDLKDFL